MAEAKRKASREMQDYQAKLRADKEAAGQAALRALGGEAKVIASAKKKSARAKSD